MDQEQILVKTDKGKDELESRRDLSPDLRHALILVDGHSTVKELLFKGAGLHLLEDSLNILLQTGFITNPTIVAAPQPTPVTAQRVPSATAPLNSSSYFWQIVCSKLSLIKS